MEDPFGQGPQQEVIRVTKEQAIESLIANPENTKLMTQFIEQLWTEVEELRMTDWDYNKTIAETYEVAARKTNHPKLREYTADSYYDLVTLALQAGDNRLYEKMTAKLHEFE
jgi:uncharacterized protein involved in type VI secretion and phage assembly